MTATFLSIIIDAVVLFAVLWVFARKLPEQLAKTKLSLEDISAQAGRVQAQLDTLQKQLTTILSTPPHELREIIHAARAIAPLLPHTPEEIPPTIPPP